MTRMLGVWRRVRARARPALVFSLAFAGLSAVVFVPLSTLFLRLFLARWGRASVGNFEIAAFLLSVPGVVAILVLVAVALVAAALQMAGLLEIVGEPPRNAWAAFRGFFSNGGRLLRLSLLRAAMLLAIAAPCLLAALLIARSAVRGHDLNALLVLKPREFWIGLVGASVPVLILVASVLWFVVRGIFTVPSLLEDPTLSPRQAMRRSGALTKGRRGRIFVALVVGVASVVVAIVVALSLLRLGSIALLDAVGTGTTAALLATGAVLLVMAAATASLAWLGQTAFVALLWTLYREASGKEAGPPSAAAPPAIALSRTWTAVAVVVLVVGLCGASARALLGDVVLDDRIEITAHRAGAIAAPENTVAALRRAIADGADWAEIDVQSTKDGALVVLHDFDLVRIGGPRRKVAEATLEEVRAIAVGKALGLEPADERVPTFEEFLAAAGDRIRLNVELKPPDAASVNPLADAVVAAMRKAGMTSRCRVCSQSYDAIQRVKGLEPTLEIGFIAGAALGDLSRLSVDYLMVKKSLATRDLIDDAHARGIQVHPWTINDPDDLLSLVDAGADNVITDAPGPFRARLLEIRALPVEQRLLLRARAALGR